MAEVRFHEVRKSFGDVHVVKGLSLDVRDGEFLVVVGSSGCGKSTVLRLLAGLETPSSGTISIGGRVVNDLRPRDRDVAMVFQSYALYPHLSVRGNLEFGLRIARTDPAEIASRVDEAARMLGLDALLERLPKELSGGQRQRVAMGRAIVRRPKVFLFDEPLSNLDASLRARMRVELRKLHRELGTTMVYVTHDQVEAMTMADRILLLDRGVAQQVGPPAELYHHPNNRFVASFLGMPGMNLLEASFAGDAVTGPGLRVALAPLVRVPGCPTSGPVTLGIRPHDLRIAANDDAPDAPVRLDAEIDLLEPLGWEVNVHARVGDAPVIVRAEVADAPALRAGQRVTLTAAPSDVRLFAGDDGRALILAPAVGA